MNLGRLKSSISRLRQKSLLKNTLWMLLGLAARLGFQAAYFVIIARALGPEQYGLFIGATSFVSILAPFASLGVGNLLVKNVSRNRTLFSEYWGNALFMIFVSGFALTVLVLLTAPIVLPETIPLTLIFLVCVTDLFLYRVLDIACQAFQAVSWLSKTAQLNTLPSVLRVIAALIFVHLFSQPTALDWTYLYVVSTAISSFLGFLLVHRSFGSPKLAIWRIKPEIVEGLYFSVSLSSQTVYNDIDKTMLARLSSLGSTGIYAAAYRLIDVAFVPVRSLLAASYANFFLKGASGIGGSMVLAKRLTPLAGTYGASAGIGLFLLAPVVPYVLGDEYAGTVEALRWLAPLPFLKAMHYFAADTLTGAGFHSVRSALQVVVAAFNVLLNLWLIPLYSWRGAAWCSLASDGLLMLGLWTMVAFLYQQQTRSFKGHKS